MALADVLNKFKSKTQSKAGLVGVSICDKELSFAYVTLNKSVPNLVACEALSTETEEDLIKALKMTVSDLSLEGTLCNFVLSPADYHLILIEAPKVEPAEMTAAAKWKIKDMIDRPIEEMVVTVFPIPSDAYRGPNDMVYVVAAKKTRIEEIVGLVEESGLILDVIDIPELVMKNLSTSYSGDENGLAFIELLGTGSTMNMSKKGAIYLTRHLNTGVDQNILDTQDWEGIKERLVLEIQRSLDYYESQMGQRQIAKLLVAPRKKDSAAIAKQLDDAMAVKVEVMNLDGNIHTDLELPLELQQSCMMAIGGALRAEQAAS